LASFFSSDYWKAFYFKAMGGQETAVDPNAMRGTFAGSSSWTGALQQPEGAISGTFAGASDFAGSLSSSGAAAGQARRRGGKDDGLRIFRRKRRAYVEFTEKRLDEIRRRERLVFDELLGPEQVIPLPVADVAPPPLPVAERKSLPPAVEYDRVMALMNASLKALSDNATRLANEQLRKQAKAAKVEPPSKDADRREQELRAMVVWLSARAAHLEEQRLEAERIALEQDEEEIIMLLLAA
jgi:hypothetical protein